MPAGALSEQLAYWREQLAGPLPHLELISNHAPSVPSPRAATDLDRADLANATGSVHLVGNLSLNYVPVRCVADLDLVTLEGQGHLEILEQETK